MTHGRLILCLAAATLGLSEARAAPLDAESCAKLKGEQTQLEHVGLRESMAKGPQWAKTNLPSDQLEQIRRLIEVEEQLLFRCSGRSLVELPPEPEPDPAAPATGTGEDGKEQAPGIPSAKAATPPAGAPRKPSGPAAEKKKADAVKKAATGTASKPPAGEAKQDEAAKKKAVVPAKQPAENSAQPPATKAATAKPKPKAKVDDAYKAPPPDPSVNPFASQVTPLDKK